ncbi:MAG: adenylosuccinate synthase [Vicingaceae bacterium]
MKVDVLLGMQWGDEGKGKVVDVLTPHYDVIARFQGGPNAGHTLEFDGVKHVLHTIPSGIFRENTINVVGNGVVIDPVVFKKEVEALEAMNVPVSTRLKVSRKAHLILPSHKLLDAASEKAKGKNKIGSTLRGIGPAYMDKTGRNGLRVGDIELKDFERRYKNLVSKHRLMLDSMGFEYSLKELEAPFLEGIEKLRSLDLIDSEVYINDCLSKEMSILAEGAQGSLLDIDFGSYPFVTSSNTITAGACTGLGVAPNKIGEVFGIFKAYCTRVGSGPFPTELHDETGERLRAAGHEFGATTGRPRRCGWLDIPALKYTTMISGVTQLIMTKSDVLASFAEVNVCSKYKVEGKELSFPPYDIKAEIEPIYECLTGWSEDLTGIRETSAFPKSLETYIKYVEEKIGIPITIVSVGPDRSQTIVRDKNKVPVLA